MGEQRRIIAIDGPAGSGKSTTARLVAQKLGFTYLDTGALYRALTYLALKRRIQLHDAAALAHLLSTSTFRIQSEADRVRVWVDDQEVTEAIRTPEVSGAVSQVASHEAVREQMVRLQRSLAQKGDFVVEGRDIGTVVFPDADLKIYLVATIEERARRRLKELKAKGHLVSLKKVEEDIKLRDKMDSERKTGPLRKAEDAIVVDTTRMTIEEQVNQIVELFKKKLL